MHVRRGQTLDVGRCTSPCKHVSNEVLCLLRHLWPMFTKMLRALLDTFDVDFEIEIVYICAAN